MEIRITLEENEDNVVTDYELELSNHGKHQISLTIFYDKERNSATIHVDKNELYNAVNLLSKL